MALNVNTANGSIYGTPGRSGPNEATLPFKYVESEVVAAAKGAELAAGEKERLYADLVSGFPPC